MHIGLFGGSFNPPHLGHLILAEHLREALALDEVWWMVAAQPPHKDAGGMASFADRVAMTQRATASNPAFRVSTLEGERRGPSFTVDTLRLLTTRHPDARFTLLMGADSYAQFGTWREPEQIARLAQLAVFSRPGTQHTPGPHPATWVPTAQIDISSTQIRERMASGQSIRYLVPESVETWIRERGLYD